MFEVSPIGRPSSATPASHATDPAAHGLIVYNVRDYGVISATEPVSHLAINAAIAAAYAAGGGEIRLPAGDILLGGSIVPKSGITLRGVNNHFTSEDECWDLIFSVTGGTVIRYPGGVCIQRPEVGYSATDYLSRFDMENIGFRDCLTIMKVGSRSYNGWSGGTMRNIYGSGITGRAFDIMNYQHIRLDGVFVEAIGGLRLAADMRISDLGEVAGGPGNSTFTDLFIKQPQAGTLMDGILIEVVEGCDTPLSVGSFYRTQVNRFNATATDTCHIRINGRNMKVVSGEFYDLDLEGTSFASVYATGASRCGFRFSGVSPESTPWACILEDCYASEVSSNQVDAKIKCLDDASAAFMTCRGVWGQVGESNRRPRGIYLDQSRGSNAFQWQFSIYDEGRLKGEDFTLTFSQTLAFEGTKMKRREVNHVGGALDEAFAADIVKLNTAASSTAMPSAASAATDCTRFLNTSAGSVTITGVTGGDITLAAGSVCDVQSISGEWYLVNKQGA